MDRVSVRVSGAYHPGRYPVLAGGGVMKRAKKAKMEAVRIPCFTTQYKFVCPHCHTAMMYQYSMGEILMMLCPHCKNPVDFREAEPRKEVS
jgi:predicted RNA-binding Zn-ribbon protein involved in translation (DUF1610 family)